MEALLDLIVKEQFINACSEEVAVYQLERGLKDLAELTTWAQQYLIAHQLGCKSKSKVQCYRYQGYGHRQAECPIKVSPSKDQKCSTPVGQSNQKKTRATVAKTHEDGEEAFICVKETLWRDPDQVETPKRAI